MAKNNINAFILQVEKDLLDKFVKDAIGTSNKIDQIQQSAIDDMSIPDTGFLQLKTFTQFQTNISKNVIAKATFITRGVKYAPYVISGTSRFPVARNYLETARNQTGQFVTTGSYTKVFKQGGKNKGGRSNAKRKF